jgi:hypothetical protein
LYIEHFDNEDKKEEDSSGAFLSQQVFADL